MTPRFWLAAIAVTALASPALAGDADCDYVEIAATNGNDGSIDADLKPLEKKLRKPPFTSWSTFKRLSSGTVSLAKVAPQPLKLKQATATVMLRDRTDKRLELSITLDNASGKRVLEAKPALKAADWLLLVVSNAKDDGHILGLTCK